MRRALAIAALGALLALSGCGYVMDKFTCAFGGYAAEGHSCNR